MSTSREKLNAVLDGTLGHFWPCIDNGQPSEDALSGYVRRSVDNLLEVDVLVEVELDELLSGKSMPNVTSCFGLVRPTAIMLLDRSQHSGRWHIGPQASSETYRFRATIPDAPLDEVTSSNIYELSTLFPGLLAWANMSTMRRTHGRDDDGINRSVEYTLESTHERTKVRITPRITLWAEPFWQVNESVESANLNTSLEIGISSTKPIEARELANELKRVRDLLSILHQRDVCGDLCHVRLDHDHYAKKRYLLWHSKLNVASSDAVDFSQKDLRPFVSLVDIGGMDSIARWIKLRKRYPRLSTAITSYWEVGRKPAIVEITELAMTMEYCVALARKRSKKNPAWTEARNHAHAIAKVVGKPFDDWCGDAEEWSLLFWEAYNHFKHNHLDRDHREIQVLAASARLLLTSYLLTRISNKKVASRKFLDDYRWNNIKGETANLIESSNLKSISVNARRKRRRGVS